MTDEGGDTGKRWTSAFAPEIARVVREALQRLPDLVVLHRLTRSAGRRDWYLIRGEPQYLGVISNGWPGDSYSIFLQRELPVRGRVDGDFEARVFHLLEQVAVPRTEVILGEHVGSDARLRDVEGWSPHEVDDLRSWLREHRGRDAVAGLHPDLFSSDPDKVVTVYVPDESGTVRPGEY